jgi:hypothetical protein
MALPIASNYDGVRYGLSPIMGKKYTLWKITVVEITLPCNYNSKNNLYTTIMQLSP